MEADCLNVFWFHRVSLSPSLSTAAALYDNAYGFFALKVNKFIELKILEAIKSEAHR